MKSLTLASVLLIAATPATSGAFNLSFVQDLLDDLGVNVDLPEVEIDLPPRAEEAVDSALERAESALDRVFGDGGVLEDLDLPSVNVPDIELPDVDQIISEALGTAQSSFENALDEFDAVLASREVDQIVEDALNKAQTEVDNALAQAELILDDIDLPDVDQIVEDALGRADSAVEDALGRADDVLDDLGDVLDGIDLSGISDTVEDALEDASGVVEEILGDGGLLDGILSNLPVNLPPIAQQAVSSVFSSFQSAGLVSAASTAVPEPTSVGLLSLGLMAAVSRRR